MTDVFIVRHGNTFDKGDIITRVGARTDLPLSISGKAQAEGLAQHFVDTVHCGFQKTYCSPLARTRQTAEKILSVFKEAPEIETLEFLREVDYGPDENQPEDAVITRLGEDALRAWDEEAIPPSGWDIDPERLKHEWRALFSDIASNDVEGPILIVTSNGIARFALDAMTEFAMKPDSIKLKTGAYGQVKITNQTIKLLSWNVRP